MLRTRLLIALLLCSLTPLTASAAPVQVKRTRVELSNMWNAYAPTLLPFSGKNHMWLGGWLAKSEEGNDNIYYSEKPLNSENPWSAPQKVFSKSNYAVNDPTVIQHPEHSDWLFMYYTALHKDAQKDAKRMVRENMIGFASSTNGGKTWTDHDLIIRQSNGFNSDGAWAPSAILAPNGKEIWLYYHTNSPSNIVLRTRLNINGWQQIGQTQQVRFPSTQNGHVNVDVAAANGVYYMVANDFKLSDVGLYVSKDGLNFSTNYATGTGLQYKTHSWTNPIIQGGPNNVLTPSLAVYSTNELLLYFGFATPGNACSRDWQKRGVADMKCSDSIHLWWLSHP